MLLWGRVGRAGVQPGDWTMKQGARAGSGEEGTCNGRFAKKGCMRRTCAAAGIAAARAGPAGEREADGQPLAAAEADRDLREVRRRRGGGRTGWMAHFYSLKVAEGCGLERIRRAVVAQLEALSRACASPPRTRTPFCALASTGARPGRDLPQKARHLGRLGLGGAGLASALASCPGGQAVRRRIEGLGWRGWTSGDRAPSRSSRRSSRSAKGHTVRGISVLPCPRAHSQAAAPFFGRARACATRSGICPGL